MSDLGPIPEDEFVLYADCFAKPGRGDDVEHLIRVLIKMVESESGTLEYAISRDTEDANHFFVFERYTGKEAFDTHIAKPEYQALLHSDAFVEFPTPKILKQLRPI